MPGVANVAIWGQRERQLQVQVDPKRMRDRGVSLERVISTTGNALWVSPLTFLEASTPGTGGFIDTPSQRIGIQHNLPIVKPEDLANIPIDESAPGVPLTLGDVATVVEDHQPLIGDAIVDGGDDGFLLVVDKLPNANTSAVTEGVEEALDGLRPGLTGLQMDTSLYRPATYVGSSVHGVTRSVLVGAALLVLLLGLVFFDWRVALTALVAVALSFVAAALVLQLFGRTFDLVVFTGLVMALGVVVHDAVVGVDTIDRARREAAGAETLSAGPAGSSSTPPSAPVAPRCGRPSCSQSPWCRSSSWTACRATPSSRPSPWPACWRWSLRWSSPRRSRPRSACSSHPGPSPAASRAWPGG